MNKSSAKALPTMIAVVGSHRSGTSCIAGMLHLLGVSMGKKFLPANSANSKGYFEAVRLERFLRQTFHSTETPNNSFEERVAWFMQWARTRCEAPIVGCKNPSLCFTLDEMAQVWPQLKIVATARPVEDSLASLKRQNWLNPLKRTPEIYASSRDEAINRLALPTLRMNYYDVLRDPAAAVDRLVEFCDIAPTDAQREAAIAHVDPALCHVNPPLI